MRDKVIALTGPNAKAFCIQLWQELTLVGRVIGSDKTADPASQLNAFKWLNEIQHRVWGAHASDREDALAHMLDRLMSHCEQERVLAYEVSAALDRAFRKVSGV